MFTSNKCTRIILRNVPFKNLLKPCYFSDQKNEFVKKIKNLDRLKTSGKFSPSDYERGKYILFLKTESVCLEKNNKLMYKDFKDVENLKKFGEVTTAFLEILTDSNPEVYLFAANLNLGPDADVEKLDVDGKFVNIYRTIFFLSEREAQRVGHARGLLTFCNTYKFCSHCGGSLKVNQGGYHKRCEKCKIVHYPQVTPVGIALIEDEKHEEVLLIRQQRHPPGMYTCISGFIEPGESLEDNVAREAAEEVGVAVSKIQYIVSHHWSIPTNQIVLGCIATAAYKNISTDEKEILDAKWVTAAELREALIRVKDVKKLQQLKPDTLWAPPSNTVSHDLMVKWLNEYHSSKPTGLVPHL